MKMEQLEANIVNKPDNINMVTNQNTQTNQTCEVFRSNNQPQAWNQQEIHSQSENLEAQSGEFSQSEALNQSATSNSSQSENSNQTVSSNQPDTSSQLSDPDSTSIRMDDYSFGLGEGNEIDEDADPRRNKCWFVSGFVISIATAITLLCFAWGSKDMTSNYAYFM